MDVTYVSVWDGGETVETDGHFDPTTGAVESLDSVEGDFDLLEDEYILLDDGSRIPVCSECHAFTTDENGDCRGNCAE